MTAHRTIDLSDIGDRRLTDPLARLELEQHARRTWGEGAVLLWPRESEPHEVVVLDSRPGVQRIELGDGVTATKGHQVAAKIATAGLTLVEFRPHEGVAIAAQLDAQTVSLRNSLAELAGAREPWSLEVAVRWDSHHGTPYVRDLMVVRSAPVDAEKRRDQWLKWVRDVLPAMPGFLWVFEQGVTPTTMRLTQVEDRLNATVSYPWDSEVSYSSIPFGITEQGDPLSLGLIEVNQLLGGVPGGGKSGGITALLCGISRLKHVALIGLDPKQVELNVWRSRFSRIATKEADATQVLTAVEAEMERRYTWLRERGKKKVHESDLSDAMPLLVVVIDELADLVSVGVSKEEKEGETVRSTRIRRLIAKGRASGVVVLTATQKPQSDVVPTALRDLIQLRVAYATTTNAMSDVILGAGMSTIGGLSHEIPASQRGVCYVVNETSRYPVRARTFWVPDEEVEQIAERTANLRVELPWMPAEGEKANVEEPVS